MNAIPSTDRLFGAGAEARRVRRRLAVAGLVLAVLAALPERVFGLHVSTPLPVVVLGIITGTTYGLLAAGLVLVYRANRIVNFAHGQIGAFAAAVFGVAVVKWHVPYYLGLPLALGFGGAAGAGAETVVVRRLRAAPRLMSVIATLGVGQFLVLLGALVSGSTSAYSYPSPPGLPEFTIEGLRVTRAYTGMLLFSPLVVIAIAVFLSRSRYGLAMRAAAANPDVARMTGVFASRMSSLSWALAGAMSAFTAILVFPLQGVSSGNSFGPSLLLRALACAVVARMVSLPVALLAGVGLGVVEQVLFLNYPKGGLLELVLFVVIVVALLFQRGQTGREEDKASWTAVQAWPPLSDAVRRVWLVRHLGRVLAGAALLAALLVPAFSSNGTAVLLVGIMSFAIVGLSVGVITGLGGQLSLAQFAFAGVGGAAAVTIAARSGNHALAVVYGGMVAGAVSLVVGLPSLRVRGLMLTVTTLSFALVTSAWLLQQPWMFPTGGTTTPPVVFGHVLSSGRAYYYFALFWLVVAVTMSWNVRRCGFGRVLVAVRDNEDAARAFTVRAGTVKVQAFILAGVLAGIGGAVFSFGLSQVGSATFPVGASIDAVAMTVIGGVSILGGPLLGAFYIRGIPEFIRTDQAALAASNLGWLLLILYAPGGLAQIARPLRDRAVRGIAALHGVDPDAVLPDAARERAETAIVLGRSGGLGASVRRSVGVAGKPLLEADRLRKRFGGVVAIEEVSLRVRRGETVGLIGPNGAGKTTLFEMLSGFTDPDGGRILFDGRDVSALGPEARGRLGLIRSFQDAALFPTMTVLDCVHVALERLAPTLFVGSVAGLGRRSNVKDRRARELVAAMGLDAYRDKQVQQLSTGTRRITELACMVALEPTVLLLDEPSSGIAQRETEALGALLRQLKRDLDLTLVVIEHDIPLIMGLADRIVAMDRGRVLADGPPDIVRNDARVIDAYLGASTTAIERSGSMPAGRKNVRLEGR
ncbi:MAG: ATP-binding cassette domain-containing protein [Actinobacteria bacterium]|nr:ATP-binding cassette domain-containing protein [Actinomycetota bacterium]